MPMDELPTDPSALIALLQTNPDLLRAVMKGVSDAGPRFDTGGGAIVEKSVETHGGHFIGRDFVQVVIRSLPKSDDTEDQGDRI